MEIEIARGENPYADFFQTAKSEDWREEAQKGTLLTKTVSAGALDDWVGLLVLPCV
jgi:hypothetical protein